LARWMRCLVVDFFTMVSDLSFEWVQKNEGRKAALSLIQPGRKGCVLMESQIAPVAHLENQPSCVGHREYRGRVSIASIQ
jgi:hypothetical protein